MARQKAKTVSPPPVRGHGETGEKTRKLSPHPLLEELLLRQQTLIAEHVKALMKAND
jgi:hypothetical protein